MTFEIWSLDLKTLEGAARAALRKYREKRGHWKKDPMIHGIKIVSPRAREG